MGAAEEGNDGLVHRSRRNDLVLTYIANIVLLTLGVASSVMIGRTLGPAGRGDYAVVLLWPTIFFGIASCGLAEAFGYVALKADRVVLKRLWSWLNVLAGMAVATSGYCLIPWILTSAELITMTRIGLLVVPMNFIITSGLAVLQSCGQLGAFNISRISFSVFYLAGIVFVIISRTPGVANYLVVFLVASGCTTLLITYQVLSLPAAVVSSGPVTSRDLLRAVTRYGLTYHASGILRLMNDKLDQIVISTTSSMTTLGLYSVAVSSASPIAAAGNAFSAVMFSEAALRGSLMRADDAIAKRLRQTIYASGALAVVGIGSLPWALPMLLGDAFAPAVPIAAICMVAAVLSGMALVVRTGLRAVNALGIVLAAEIGFSLTLPIPLLVLLPRLQGVGAALAVLGAYIGSVGIMVYLVRLGGARHVGRLSLKRSDLESVVIRRDTACDEAVDPKTNWEPVERTKRLRFTGGDVTRDR